MVLEDRSYTLQSYFYKILWKTLPQSISFKAANSFLPSFSGINLEFALNSHSAPERAPKTTLKATYNFQKLD